MNDEVQAERKYLPITGLTKKWHGGDTQDSPNSSVPTTDGRWKGAAAGRRRPVKGRAAAPRPAGRARSRLGASADVQSFVPFGGLNVTRQMAYTTNTSVG